MLVDISDIRKDLNEREFMNDVYRTFRIISRGL